MSEAAGKKKWSRGAALLHKCVDPIFPNTIGFIVSWFGTALLVRARDPPKTWPQQEPHTEYLTVKSVTDDFRYVIN